MLPMLATITLFLTINLFGKEFTKHHFRSLILFDMILSGVLCHSIGTRINKPGAYLSLRSRGTAPDKANVHQLLKIPLQHWSWIHFILTIIFIYCWKPVSS